MWSTAGSQEILDVTCWQPLAQRFYKDEGKRGHTRKHCRRACLLWRTEDFVHGHFVHGLFVVLKLIINQGRGPRTFEKVVRGRWHYQSPAVHLAPRIHTPANPPDRALCLPSFSKCITRLLSRPPSPSSPTSGNLPLPPTVARPLSKGPHAPGRFRF